MGKTPLRSIRIPDDEWNPALAAAEANGESVSEVVRRKLGEYVEESITPPDRTDDAPA